MCSTHLYLGLSVVHHLGLAQEGCSPGSRIAEEDLFDPGDFHIEAHSG